MKKFILTSILFCFSFSINAAPVDFSCLDGKSTYSLTKDSSDVYTDEKLGTVFLSSKEDGKYLVLDSKGEHLIFEKHVVIMFTKNGDRYESGDLWLIPLCSTNEFYLSGPKTKGVTDFSVVIFGKL
jgi:hypothetical protein